jgi:hypothetical protein
MGSPQGDFPHSQASSCARPVLILWFPYRDLSRIPCIKHNNADNPEKLVDLSERARPALREGEREICIKGQNLHKIAISSRHAYN